MTENRLGKYNLIRHIATGGMAEIWLAEQRGPSGFNKEIVIKRILPQLADDKQMMQMFVDEARTVAYLTHPNIGQVFELGEDDGDYYIAMEFIDGVDLAELREEVADRGMSLPVSYGAKIVSDVLTALDYAHNFIDREGNHAGIIHRDVSPHNVLISNDGVVKLVDFGVAKATFNSHKTETGAVKGKFAYMAPEQIENKDLDHRVDVFATGTLFFELLTGKKPFGEDLRAVSLIISADSTVPDPRTIRKDIPDAVAEIILKSLKRDRKERYTSAAEMDQAIQAYLRSCGQAVTSRELSVMVRQLRDLPTSKPTDQLFGFQKHGVEKAGPRMTVNQQLEVEEAAPALKDTTAERPVVRKKARREGSGMTRALKVKAESEGMSLGLIAVFVVMILGLLATVVVGGFLFVRHSGTDTNPELAEVITDDEGQEEERSAWRHSGGNIVSIVSSEPADLYYDGDKVGRTPFDTLLEPGQYDLELRTEDKTKEVNIRVESGRSIQRYRFDL